MVGAFFYGGAIFHANSIKFCPPPYYMNIHGGGIFLRGGGHFFMQQVNLFEIHSDNFLPNCFNTNPFIKSKTFNL